MLMLLLIQLDNWICEYCDLVCFVIHELFCNSVITLLCTAKEVQLKIKLTSLGIIEL